jgi:hypothetical protein
MKKLLFVVLCVISPAALAFAQAPQAVQSGFTVEREIGGAEKHNYEVTLAKGELLTFVAEQRGVDVVLRVYAPDGKFYDRVDTPNGREGEERLKMVSMTDGRYRIEINRYFEPDPTGKYFVKTVEIRKATNAELKAARLRDELLKIAVEDTRVGSEPEIYKRRYQNTAFLTNEGGFLNTAAVLTEATTKNPPKMPEGYTFEDELSDARVESFGDTALLNVRQSYNYKNQTKNQDVKAVQRIGYVFKRTKGEWRIISVQRTLVPADLLPRFVKLSAEQLEPLLGVYDGGNPSELFTVTRDGERLYGKLPDGEKFELTPETENVFRSGTFSIAFIRGADGAATQVVVHTPPPDNRTIIQIKVK